MAAAIYGPNMTLHEGDRLAEFELVSTSGPWSTAAHRNRGVALVLILHRHLA